MALTQDEVQRAIKKLKNWKAAGNDEITNEDIKLVESLRPGLVLNILQLLWENEICPEQFKKSIIHLFPKPHKPGKRRSLRFQKNYRPISLLPTFRKLYEAILCDRIIKVVKLNESQFGFRAGRSTIDCIFLLHEAILEARFVRKGKMGGCNQRLLTAFLDFRGAFDGVPRERLWKKMYMRFGICGKLLRVIKDLFTNITGVFP